MIEINDLEGFRALLDEQDAVFAWFGGDHCNVCQVLRPQVFAMLEEAFPLLTLAYIDTARAAELAAQMGVFTIPSMIAYFDGRETLRRERNVSLGDLRTGLRRPYSLFFD